MSLPDGWTYADEKPVVGLPKGWSYVEPERRIAPPTAADFQRATSFEPGELPTSAEPVQSPVDAAARNFAQSAVAGIGGGAKGLAVAGAFGPGEATEPGALPTQSTIDRLQRVITQPKVEQLKAVTSDPLYQWGKAFQEAAKEVYPVSDKEQQSALVSLAGQAGGFLPLIASGEAAPITIGLQSMGDGLEQAYDQQRAKGVSEEEAAKQAVDRAMASGAVQATIFSVIPAPLRKTLDKVIVDKFARTTLTRFLAGRAAQGAEGAALGAASKAGDNAAMGRPIGEDIGPSAAGLGAMQMLMPRGNTGRELDTAKNLPESPATLKAQQEQLIAGRRPAQMFPVDETGKAPTELPLPDGMERVETPRGVFHFNPELIDADRIRTASAAGRENEVLAMGPVSKPEADARTAAGEKTLAVTERTPDGTEVKSVVATDRTAPAVTRELDATKTPGNTVQPEPISRTVAERSGNLVDELMTKDAQRALDRQTAEAKEKADRQARQQDLADKRARFDERIGVARQTFAKPDATFAEVKGALESVKFYADDNSLGLTTAQRQTAAAARSALEKRLAEMQPAEDARRAAEAQQTATAAAAEEARKNAAVTQDKAAVKAAAEAGIGADGATDYTRLAENKLADMAAAGDKRAERELMQRGDRAGAPESESLLDALKSIRLPLNDRTLDAELRQLVFEDMDTAMRKRLTSPRAGSLDRVAEALRGRGFDTKTPADVIELVKRALGGEDIRARPGADEQVEFAQVKRVKMLTKSIKTPYGSRYYSFDLDGDFWHVRLADHENKAQDSSLTYLAKDVAARKSQTGMDRPHDINVVLKKPIENETDAADLIGEVIAHLPPKARYRENIGGKLFGNDDITVYVTPEQLTYRYAPLSPNGYLGTGIVESVNRKQSKATNTTEDARQSIGRRSTETATQTATQSGIAVNQRVYSLTVAEAAREMAAIRRAFPELTRDYDVQVGLVEDDLRRRGYQGAVPKAVQAALLRLNGERSLIVLAARAYRDRAKGAALLTHEVAHTYFDTLPGETRDQLAELHRQEVQGKTGPLYRDGKLQSELAYVEDLNENGTKEWFAERIARLNEAWAHGRIDAAEHTLLSRLAYQLRETVRRVWATFATRAGIDPESELFVREFRRFFAAGADHDIGRAAGAAYAEKKGSFATGKKEAARIVDEAPRVESLPSDRRSSLVAELKRARTLRDDAIKAGDAEAEAQHQKRASALLRTLDDEFPGWDSPPREAEPPKGPPDEPPPPTGDRPEDAEPSPFHGYDAEAMPVRAGKWAEVYGHDAVQPSVFSRSWHKVADVIHGIKGAVPELPTFPAAMWNKADEFIRREGPQFYNRVREGLRVLKSGNDYIQRTAQDQVARIVRPLIEAGGDFSAGDYAALRNAQETARLRKAAGKAPLPALRARIEALNGKLESNPYVLFNRLVLALDLHWRQQNLKDSEGNAIALPANVNPAEVKAELQRLGERIEASPHRDLIKTAVAEHMALVKQVADDLKGRELLAGDELANPYYFPHITLETTRGGKTEQRELRVERVRPGTEADFRGYLIDPVGSEKPISTDYVRSMYYHLVQVGAHNFKADAVRDFFRPYDVRRKIEDRAKQLSRERGVPVSWQQAFHEEFAPAGYVLYGTDSRDAFPSIEVNRDALARRLGVMLTSDDLQKQLHELGLKGVTLLPDDLQETLQQGAKETWIVPARVAEALRGIADRQAKNDDALAAAMKWTLGKWKAWKLFMPWNHVRYEYGNIVADLEKLLSADPRTFKYLPGSAKELREFWRGGMPSEDLRAALKEGVINAITAQEMGGLTRAKAFEVFQTRAERAWNTFKQRGSSILYQPITSSLGLGDFSNPELSALREAITRYAKFKADLEAIRAGARPHYAGAYWRDIEAMQDSAPGAGDKSIRQAAAISKATFGDYGDLSVLGETMREKFIPFYSWMEVNFKYHANLFRNLRDMVHAGEASKAEAAKAGTRAAAVLASGFTARAAGAVALRLALPYVAVTLWNSTGDRDQLEKQLSDEDRRRFHIILGADKDGKVSVVYGQTAFMDVAKWISGPAFVQAMAGWLNGRTDFPTAFSTWRDQIVPDLVNNTLGSAGPFFKVPYTLASKKNPFPNVLDQRTVPAFDMRRVILGQLTDDFTADQIERVVSRDYYGSKDVGDWAKQLVLQVRQRDPKAWAFYEIKDKANDFLEQQTGQHRDNSFDAPDQQVLRNFRRALYRGDVEKATQFYLRLLDYGYTAERFETSVRSQDPLSVLPKTLRKAFVNSLTPDERDQLREAFEFYGQMSGLRGAGRQLFPSQRWGQRGLERYQAQPRTDRLQQRMDRVEDMTDAQQRADRDLRRSLQRRH